VSPRSCLFLSCKYPDPRYFTEILVQGPSDAQTGTIFQTDIARTRAGRSAFPAAQAPGRTAVSCPGGGQFGRTADRCPGSRGRIALGFAGHSLLRGGLNRADALPANAEFGSDAIVGAPAWHEGATRGSAAAGYSSARADRLWSRYSLNLDVRSF